MSARRVESMGLSHAQDVITDLESGLRWTIESVEVLTRAGQLDEARELIEAQQAELDDAIKMLSFDTGTGRRRAMSLATRSLAFAAAAAVVVLSIGVVVMRNSGAADPQTIAIAPTDIVRTATTSPDVRAPSASPRTAAVKPAVVPPRRGRVGTNAPIVDNRVRSAVRADPPTVNATETVSATPLPEPLPEYVRRIS